jgi:2-keto-4-pentenoate hydratase/2-oxohepta-3-ene-1,7-dioic acid hydratase in catechol pathway
MKLIRFGAAGAERPGVHMDGINYDLSSFIRDYDELFFASDGLNDLAAILEREKGKLPVVPAETIPKNSVKTDWEVELAFIMGKKASYVEVEEAMDYVAGYALHNDVSEREFQLERGGTWDKGKGCDTFAPIGPWLVTKDEITDPHNLRLWLSLNGKMMQDSNTNDLIFNIPFLVSYISQFMTLLPGDIISTGTPAGVGFTPNIYLKEGDVVELGIDGLGTSRQVCHNYRK